MAKIYRLAVGFWLPIKYTDNEQINRGEAYFRTEINSPWIV